PAGAGRTAGRQVSQLALLPAASSARRRRQGPYGGSKSRATMAVVLTPESRIVVQGATGYQGQFHIAQMKQFGTVVVAGVTPGKGGEKVHDVPVFDTVLEAVQKAGANTSLVFVPAAFAKDAV